MAKERMVVHVSFDLEGDNGSGVHDLPTEVYVSCRSCDSTDADMLGSARTIKVAITGTDTLNDIRDDIVAAVNTELGVS